MADERKIGRRHVDRHERMHGGVGRVAVDHLMGTDDLAGRGGMFAKVVVRPGSSIGYHEHKDETETYYIISGEGVYFDGKQKLIAKAGDVFHCESGCGHSIENTCKKQKLELVALILPL